MKIAVEKGQSTRPEIKLGICGEHGGDPDSVKFCHRLGLTYVSCSPFRVPVARLAAAQAALEQESKAPKIKLNGKLSRNGLKKSGKSKNRLQRA
jgi:pyruvate,orthophosphate dikinase